MGLDVSHDCWHGPYSRFNRFRTALVRVAWGLDLADFEGFESMKHHFHDFKPRSFDTVAGDPLVPLINHSDCDGEIAIEHLIPLAEALEELAPRLKYADDFKECALQFARGLRDAHALGERVVFR